MVQRNHSHRYVPRFRRDTGGGQEDEERVVGTGFRTGGGGAGWERRQGIERGEDIPRSTLTDMRICALDFEALHAEDHSDCADNNIHQIPPFVLLFTLPIFPIRRGKEKRLFDRSQIVDVSLDDMQVWILS